MKDRQCEPEQFEDRIIFMSMFNDTLWREKGNAEKCENNSREVVNYVRGFPRGHWTFLGHGSEKKWYGTYSGKFDGVSDKTAEDMMLGFAETINPMFRASSALERGELRCKGVGKQTIHFNGREEKSWINPAHDYFCKSVPYLWSSSRFVQGGIQRYHDFGKPEAHDHLETMEIPTETSTADPCTNEQRQGNLLQDYECKFEQLSDDQKLNAGLKIVERGEYFITLDAEGLSGTVHLCRECTLPLNHPRAQARGWIRRNTKIGPVLNILDCHHEDRHLCFKTEPLLGFESWMELKST